MVLRIGLTGGIGSGKTTVAKIFETLGVPVYYADDEAKRLMNADPALKAAITKHFGEKSYNEQGLDRSYIASVVFNDKKKLELLNSLTHPATIRDAEEWMKKQNVPYIIKEAALLFESGANKSVDKVIGVSAPLQLRIKRIVKRDGMTEEEASKRMKRQMNEEEKMKLCDWVIVNNEEQMLLPQVLELHQKFSTAAAPPR